jgi:hypothetical protein
MSLAVHPGPTVCQFCRVDLGDKNEKRVHATLDHPPGSVPHRFSACPSCAERTFSDVACSCGHPPRDLNPTTERTNP